MRDNSTKCSWVGKLRFVVSRMFVLVKLTRAYLYDAMHYLMHSSTFLPSTRRKDMLEARIMASSHVIEKGLSFKEVRINFGRDVVDSLFYMLGVYQSKYSRYWADSHACSVGRAVLAQYIAFHQERDQDVSDLVSRLESLNSKVLLEFGGTKELSKNDILLAGKGDFREFIRSRHSTRTFTDEAVPLESIQKAIEIAQYSPSACNRQSSRVRIVCEPHVIETVLHYQNGSAGFGHMADKLLVVTSNINAFEGVQERNQAFIDGGIYAMNLLYGLHYEGIGACCLGWLSHPKLERLLRKIVKIDVGERIIVIIAMGQMPDHFRVAESSRKPWKDICTII